MICLHLSDSLFDLVLNLVFDYATTNAKSNAVRAFGQLVACLARVRPDKTLSRFLAHCTAEIEEELKHGASSVRTTSTHAAVPSDTTLHWSASCFPAFFHCHRTKPHCNLDRHGHTSWMSRLRWLCSMSSVNNVNPRQPVLIVIYCSFCHLKHRFLG